VRMPQGFEWLVIAGIVLLLFGAKRMPDASRSLGRSLRIFKAETRSAIASARDQDTAVGRSSATQSSRSA
jgi:sec-independent protein translocase protein TatA